ncbi:MAG: hypothetical protein MHM6MM_001405 [Cercozoa sp. M6MM]
MGAEESRATREAAKTPSTNRPVTLKTRRKEVKKQGDPELLGRLEQLRVFESLSHKLPSETLRNDRAAFSDELTQLLLDVRQHYTLLRQQSEENQAILEHTVQRIAHQSAQSKAKQERARNRAADVHRAARLLSAASQLMLETRMRTRCAQRQFERLNDALGAFEPRRPNQS